MGALESAFRSSNTGRRGVILGFCDKVRDGADARVRHSVAAWIAITKHTDGEGAGKVGELEFRGAGFVEVAHGGDEAKDARCSC